MVTNLVLNEQAVGMTSELIVAAIIALCVLGLIRNEWVVRNLKRRLRAVTNDREMAEFDRYWHYYRMVFSFWIWDFEKMKNEVAPSPQE